MYLVDPNIFLEVMLAQARRDECKAFLKILKVGRAQAFVTDFSLYSIMIIMASFPKMKELKILLSSLSAYRGLRLYRSNLTDMLKAVKIRMERGLDMDDSIHYAAALSLGVKAIVSFDTHFDGLQISRMEPAQVLAEV